MPDIEIAKLTDRFMRRIQVALTRAAPAFDTHRLGPSGGIVLLTLAEMAPARMQDLVQAMARDKSQMTRSVRALEDKGLVTRADDPSDARASLLTLTPLGEAAVAGLQGAVAEALDGVLAPLSEEERGALRGLLARL